MIYPLYSNIRRRGYLCLLVGENHKIVIGNVIYDINFSDTMREEDALLYCNNLKMTMKCQPEQKTYQLIALKSYLGVRKRPFLAL